MQVLGFMRLRGTAEGRARLKAWNAAAIAFMRSYGPYWDTRRQARAVSGVWLCASLIRNMRCCVC